VGSEVRTVARTNVQCPMMKHQKAFAFFWYKKKRMKRTAIQRTLYSENIMASQLVWGAEPIVREVQMVVVVVVLNGGIACAAADLIGE